MSNLEKHLITNKESAILAEEYEKSNYVAINAKRPTKKPDSKTYTYDLEVLQDYINLIREGMEKKGIKNNAAPISIPATTGFTMFLFIISILKMYNTLLC